jgi:hypothetical protein
MKAITVTSLATFFLVSSAEAFGPVGVNKKSPSLFVQRTNKANEAGECKDVETGAGRRNILVKLASCFLTVGGTCFDAPLLARAASTDSSRAGGAFTLLAEEIKTLDLSLPTYDTINTLKSNAETNKALGVESPPDAPSKDPAASRKKKKSSAGGSGGGGNPLSNVLPSMSKSVDKKRRPSSQTSERPAAVRRIQEEKTEDEVKTMDLSLPSYAEGIQTRERSIFAL